MPASNIGVIIKALTPVLAVQLTPTAPEKAVGPGPCPWDTVTHVGHPDGAAGLELQFIPTDQSEEPASEHDFIEFLLNLSPSLSETLSQLSTATWKNSSLKLFQVPLALKEEQVMLNNTFSFLGRFIYLFVF